MKVNFALYEKTKVTENRNNHLFVKYVECFLVSYQVKHIQRPNSTVCMNGIHFLVLLFLHNIILQ